MNENNQKYIEESEKESEEEFEERIREMDKRLKSIGGMYQQGFDSKTQEQKDEELHRKHEYYRDLREEERTCDAQSTPLNGQGIDEKSSFLLC